MIDAHIHVVPPNLPGVGPLSPLLAQAPESLALVLHEEMQQAGISAALAMGSANGPEDDPLGVNATLAVARLVPGLHAIGVANPLRPDPEHLRRVEKVLAGGAVRALKVYLGYLHFPPDHPGYRPYYELAERFRLPVCLHTGDTYSPYAKVRFAHPLLVDDVAVDHPRVKFVLAHLGNPWLTEAAEVIYKNLNVWADLSGLVVGSRESFAGLGEGMSAPESRLEQSVDEEQQERLLDLSAEVRRAFRYAERPNRFLYGSDWPLAPLSVYRSFIARVIPETYHPLIFEENARGLFGI
jgi:predicted TIM-barrel fold metal-dependent hydrolase